MIVCSPTPTVVIAVYTVAEALYYTALSQQAAWPWRRTVLLSFSEIAEPLVRRAGMQVLSVFKAQRALPADLDPEGELARLGSPAEALSLRHEMVNNGLSYLAARRKFVRRLLAIERLLGPWRDATVIQELGGFASNLALLAWCRLQRQPHLSIEPGMFPGRLLFSRDSFFVDLHGVQPLAEDVAAGDLARRAFCDRPAFLVPLKDRAHFRRMGLRRLFSGRQVYRTARKVYRLAVLRREEEFAMVRMLVREQIARYFRHRRIKGTYRLPAVGARYVYYPLHVPWDVQLTFRCPACLDQARLLRRLVAALPEDVVVVTKEHPAAVGSFSTEPLADLRAAGRVLFAPPETNSLVLARGALAVITVNSKAGFEAMMAGLPVITLGPSFYRGHGLTTDVDDPEAAARCVLTGARAPQEEAVRAFVGRCWAATVPGELYSEEAEHLRLSAFGYAQAARAAHTAGVNGRP
ncbi:MAG: hypothetical protein H0X38_00710 [Planctomycetes bacterium]|nr:hypothetical protein [Planctomycetota bacterium]